MANVKANEFLTLKDMTLRSGCTARTVRYYEHQGLIQALRSPGGHRLFPPQELERLHFISHLREAGWSIEQIFTLLNFRNSEHKEQVACKKLDQFVSQEIENLERKIAALQGLQDDLKATQQLLSICCECTEKNHSLDCQSCQRVPQRSQQPEGFRLFWHSQTSRSSTPSAVPLQDEAHQDHFQQRKT